MANTCRACRLPGPVRDKLAELHRRDVPYRAISEELGADGFPLHRDAIWRHCRDHLPPADLLDADLPSAAAERAIGIVVAAVVGPVFTGWPGMAGRAASRLRAEGLAAAADALWAAADPPESVRAGILAAIGTPASELLEARALTQAVRNVLGSGHPAIGRELAAACRDVGADDLADALDDLAAAVEDSDDPAERDAEIGRRARAAAIAVDGPGGRRDLLLPSTGCPTTATTSKESP